MLAQCMVLNKILSTNDFSIVETNNLSADFFESFKAEFNFIKDHKTHYGKVPDILTFKNIFPEFELQEVQEPDSYLVDQLFDEYYNECAAKLFNATKKKVESGASGRQTFLDLKKAILDMEPTSSINCTDLITDTSRYEHYLERTTDKKKVIYFHRVS